MKRAAFHSTCIIRTEDVWMALTTYILAPERYVFDYIVTPSPNTTSIEIRNCNLYSARIRSDVFYI